MKVRTKAREDLIIETASQVFLEFGFEGASMAEITRRVGGSKATVYGYFQSKEKLFLSVVHTEAKRHLDAAGADVAAHRPGSLRDDLVRFGAALVTFVCSEVGIAGLRMVMARAGQSDIGRLFYEEGPAQGLRMMACALQAAMERGELRQTDPLIAAQHLEGLLTSETKPRLFHQQTEAMSSKQATQIAKRAVDVFLQGYGT